MKKLRVGVVGVGHIGSNHARIYSDLANAELVAILDIDPPRADEIGRKYKAKVAASLTEFAGMIDAASVATPTCRIEERAARPAPICSCIAFSALSRKNALILEPRWRT